MIITEYQDLIKVAIDSGEEQYINPRVSKIVKDGMIVGCVWKDWHFPTCSGSGSLGSKGCSCVGVLRKHLNDTNILTFIEDVIHELGDVTQ